MDHVPQLCDKYQRVSSKTSRVGMIPTKSTHLTWTRYLGAQFHFNGCGFFFTIVFRGPISQLMKIMAIVTAMNVPSTAPTRRLYIAFYSIYILSNPIKPPCLYVIQWMVVSENRGTPSFHHLIFGFSIINHPQWGSSIYGNPHIKLVSSITMVYNTYNILYPLVN